MCNLRPPQETPRAGKEGGSGGWGLENARLASGGRTRRRRRRRASRPLPSSLRLVQAQPQHPSPRLRQPLLKEPPDFRRMAQTAGKQNFSFASPSLAFPPAELRASPSNQLCDKVAGRWIAALSLSPPSRGPSSAARSWGRGPAPRALVALTCGRRPEGSFVPASPTLPPGEAFVTTGSDISPEQ